MGHALNNTLQDVIIRYKRMDGYSALWLPGTDHASIATELKIVEQLIKEGTSKEKIGREEFLKKAWAWKETYGGTIVNQLKRLGSSCDWSRLAFTMDERCNKAVREVFVNLYEKGLIYRGNRMTHWCVGCKTAISDAEIEYEEKQGSLWYIKYPYSDGTGFLTVATTRPETMLGDTAVAVNPDDTRYKSLIGKTLKLPLTDREIPVIADNYVELGFGTGAVKITPAHDPNDFEVGKRHSLAVICVIEADGKMSENLGKYSKLDRAEARKAIVSDLEKQGLLEKTESHTHNVGVCYRCKKVIEPRVCEQWYLKMDELAKPAIDVVKSGKIKFIPERFDKIYFNWLENIKDWCISRQLWWGHRIPCWYCESCGKLIVSKTDPTECPDCKSQALHRDEDVLDTWFSSALWPFSTLGYPEKTEDLKYFYPTNVLVTAYDIIFFWVARMIFSGLEHMGEIPFSDVLIHGIVRDANGKKMSKSLGNGIDPLVVIDEYGADTLRYSLSAGVAPGGDIRFSQEKTEAARNFMNKLWNASRYVVMNLENASLPKFSHAKLSDADKWILTKLSYVTADVRKNLDKYEIGIALTKLYDFIWSDYCDWYIELTKPVLYDTQSPKRLDALAVLKHVLAEILKLLHPFVPFITEEIWSQLNISEAIMIEQYPLFEKKFCFEREFSEFEFIKEAIGKIRNIRSEMNVPIAKKLPIFIKTKHEKTFEKASVYVAKLAGVASVSFVKEKSEAGEKTVAIVTGNAEIFIPLGELVDTEKERERLLKELKKVTDEIARGEKLLGNEGFVAKAPKNLISQEREKLEANKTLGERLLKQLGQL